jgi:hypothetical protein
VLAPEPAEPALIVPEPSEPPPEQPSHNETRETTTHPPASDDLMGPC